MAYKIMIDEQYEDMRAFLTSIPSIFDKEGVEIYDGRNTIKSCTSCNILIMPTSNALIPMIYTIWVANEMAKPLKEPRLWRLSQRTCTTKGCCIKTFRLVIFFGIRTKRDIISL